MKGSARKLLAAGILLVSGCAFSSQGTDLIHEGMPEARVVEILGPPAESQELGESKTLAYWFPRNPLSRGPVRPGQKAFVVYLEDGLVVSSGKGKPQNLTASRDRPSIN